MTLTDEEKNTIQEKIKAIEAVQNKYHAKVAEINQVIGGFWELFRDTPKNTDCTSMTDEEIQASKTNLLTHAQTIIDTW